MRIPLLTRLRGFFARDELTYWFGYFTDEEKHLRRMTVWQLASVIHDESIRKTAPERSIVAGHMLSVRLAAIQARSTYIAAALGVIGGALLTAALQKPAEQVNCVHDREKAAASQAGRNEGIPPSTVATEHIKKPMSRRDQDPGQPHPQNKP